MSVHKVLLKIHLWVGMAAGLLLLAIGGTGCFLAFEKEIDRGLNPSLFHVTPGPSRVPLAELIAKVPKTYPRTRVASLILPPRDDIAYVANLNRGGQVFLDPFTGKILGQRTLRDGLASNIRQFHAKLLLGKPGEKIVGYSSLLLVLISITGLILWWPRKLMSIHRKATWKLINFELHSVIGFFSSLVVLILALTGSVISFSETAIPWIFKITGEPPPPIALPAFQVPEGAKPITIERLIAIAASALPEARTTIVPVPRANDEAYVEVTKHLPGDGNYGECLVIVNQYTGEVARIDDSRTAPAGTKALSLNRSLHFGDVFGLPSRIVAALASFCLVLQAISGFVIWLARQTRKSKKAASALRVQEQAG